MRISCQSFSLPKAGRSFADCEDAYFPGDLDTHQLYEINHENTDVFRASVSDGATDSIFSKLWAQLLAFGYGAGKWASDITAESVLEEQTAWLDFLAKQQLPWYAEEKAELGAFAAMVGLTVFNDSKRWTAMAVGDCCIFHIRNGACIKSFPIASAAAFSNFPLLLCSVAERNTNVFESKQIVSDGTWEAGDQFILMSDTVACWFLSQMEQGNTESLVAALDNAQSLDTFVSLINHARTTKGADGNVQMRDDDVTVTLVKVVDDASAPLPKKFDSQALAAAIRPTVEIPKIAVSEKRNTAELPPIPVQNKSALAVVAPVAPPGVPAPVSSTSTPSATSVSAPTAPSAAAPSAPHKSTAPASAHSSSSYTHDATNSNGGMVVREPPSAESNYASRTRTKSNQPGFVVVIASMILVAVIGAVALFAPKSEKHPKKVETPAASESVAAPSLTKSDDTSAKQSGGHHRAKHKLKKTHPIAPAPSRTASAGTAATGQTAVGAPPRAPAATASPDAVAPNTNSPNPSDSGQMPVQLPAREPVRKSPQTTPQLAPDRGAAKPASRPMSRSLDRMPPQAPERIRVPIPAPDRTSGLPVQLPDQIPQDRGLDHSPIGQHRRGVRPDKIYPDKRKQNDLPENLNSQN
ncbi:MAG: hypothetical protein JST89_23210 [Cyanobacteria bacterium SZAS-4]|nr:hypothetical protein [Cyanobacteria bacterium SZAS-4]